MIYIHVNPTTCRLWRSNLIQSNLVTEDTPFNHVMTRCVRRAFLCGKDKYSGNCYEHRRKPIVERIKLLASVFNIEVCSYALS